MVGYKSICPNGKKLVKGECIENKYKWGNIVKGKCECRKGQKEVNGECKHVNVKEVKW